MNAETENHNGEPQTEVIGYCMKCGNALESDKLFCTSCGARIPQNLLDQYAEKEEKKRLEKEREAERIRRLEEEKAAAEEADLLAEAKRAAALVTEEGGNKMFCGKCGTENADTAKFCKKCGNKLSKPLGAAAPEAGQPTASQPKPSPYTPAPQPKPNPHTPQTKPGDGTKSPLPVIMIGCVAALIVLIGGGILLSAMPKTINLNKYLVIETTGYEGYGTAAATVDWAAVEEKYGSKLKLKNVGKSTIFGDLSDWYTPVGVLQDAVSVRLDGKENLSNGDEVSYTWNVDEDYRKLINCKLKYKDGKDKVKGLSEIATFDPFADLDVSFSGISPNGSINMVYTGSELNSYDFSCNQGGGLSIGDIVTITIPQEKIMQCAENFGKIPASLEKEYKVEGLSSYLAKCSELSGEDLAAMQQQAQDHYRAGAAQYWHESVTLNSFTYLGDYLLTAKSSDIWGSHNFLYLVFKIQSSENFANDNGSYNGNTDTYWYVRYDDLVVKADGRLDFDVTTYSVPGEEVTVDSGVEAGWSTMTWTYQGFKSLEDLYKNAVTSNIENYNHEDNVDESLASAAAPQQENVTAESAVEAEGDGMAANAEGYILPGSDKKLLTEKDLKGLSEEELKLARNEIYARHGRKFKDKEIQKYFDGCDWYEGTIKAKDFDESILTETEIKNRDLIVEYEKKQGYR